MLDPLSSRSTVANGKHTSLSNFVDRNRSRVLKYACNALAVFVLAALLIPVSGTVSAKIVAIVYDDSGSMKYRRFLPAFGAALLIATPGRAIWPRSAIDHVVFGFSQCLGRRLFGQRHADNRREHQIYRNKFRAPAYRYEVFPSESAHRRVVDETNKRWSEVAGGTPYGALETMLHVLAEESSRAETIHFVFITDASSKKRFPMPRRHEIPCAFMINAFKVL